MEFKIREIKQINNDFLGDEFADSFIPSFCLTVYKYQGGEINTDYNIYDINGMDKKTIIYNKS